MGEYTPKYIPEMIIEYTVIQGQKQTFNQPGFEPEIDINDIQINGDYVSWFLFNLLIEQHEKEWINEILKGE